MSLRIPAALSVFLVMSSLALRATRISPLAAFRNE